MLMRQMAWVIVKKLVKLTVLSSFVAKFAGLGVLHVALPPPDPCINVTLMIMLFRLMVKPA